MEKQTEYMRHIRQYRPNYQETIPDVIAAYESLQNAAYKDGALGHKIKRLIALGIAIGGGCDPCILYQTEQAVMAGATKAEIMETVAVTIAIKGSTARGWSWRVVELLEELGVL